MARWTDGAARVHGGPTGQRGQGGTRTRRRTGQSRASGHSEARELADGGGKERGQHRGPFASLTGAQVAVW
jgi:hypothetical protein